MGKWKVALGVMLGILILGIAGTVMFKLGYFEGITKRQVKIFAIIFVSILALVGLIYGAYRLFSRKEQKEESKIDPPKVIVHSYRATEIWTEEFILRNRIQYRITTDNKIVPINPDAVVIRNEKSHPDETGQTPDRFISFEATVREGSRPGICTVSIRSDLGEDHIRENWNQWIVDHKSMNIMDINFERLPKTSHREFKERLAMRALEMQEEGHSIEEARRILEPFEQEEGNGKAVMVAERAKKDNEQIKIVMDQADDDEIDTAESIRDDIEAYRKGR